MNDPEGILEFQERKSDSVAAATGTACGIENGIM
jgi:hypothetical protein